MGNAYPHKNLERLISALKIQNKKHEEKKEENIELLKVPVVKADHLKIIQPV